MTTKIDWKNLKFDRNERDYIDDAFNLLLKKYRESKETGKFMFIFDLRNKLSGHLNERWAE